MTMWLRRGLNIRSYVYKVLILIYFDEEREGCVRDDVKELPYLLMLKNFWP